MHLLFASWNSTDVTDYPYQNWHLPLKKIFSEITIFDPRDLYFKNGKDVMNKKFLDVIEETKPDYIFLNMVYDEFYIETLEKIKTISPKTTLVSFFSDDEWRFDNYSMYFYDIMDYCITTYPPSYRKALAMGLKNFYLIMYSCNTNFYKKTSAEKIYDVSFIGGPSDERKAMIKYLIQHGVRVHIWGRGWDSLDDFADYKNHYHGIAQDFVALTNQSKIMLSFLQSGSGTIQIKGRLTEVAGCGTFQIVTASDVIKKELFKEGVECAYFAGGPDLLEKVNYYLKNETERERIAKKSYDKVIKHFNWDNQFSKFFKQAQKTKPKKQKIVDKKSLIVSFNPRFVKDDFLNTVVHVNKTDTEKIKTILENMQEDYLTIVDREAHFTDFSKRFKDLAFSQDIDVVLNDFGVRTKKLGEIFVMRSTLLHRDEDMSDFFPLPCFSFSKHFVKNNVDLILRMIKDDKVISGKLKDVPKIAFPLVYFTKVKTKKPKSKYGTTRKFEISLFNMYYNKEYLKLPFYSLGLFTHFLRHGNMFMLQYMKSDMRNPLRK